MVKTSAPKREHADGDKPFHDARDVEEAEREGIDPRRLRRADRDTPGGYGTVT